VTQRVDFSANAPVYDRRHGAFLSDDAARRLWLAAGLQSTARVLDVGAGTGRVFIPIAARAREVVALEPALGKVKELQVKAEGANVSIVVGEGGRPSSAPGFAPLVRATGLPCPLPARVTVTISYPSVSRRRMFCETRLDVLRRNGVGWRFERDVQLGIS
jgi:SAM-dependent methyltransferase